MSRRPARRRSVLSTQYSVLVLFLLAACARPLGGGSGAPPARIAYVTPDNAIAVIDATGGTPTLLSDSARPVTATTGPNRLTRRYAWPTWSPDGRRVAFMALDDNGISGGVLVAGADGRNRVTIHEMPSAYPIYLSWSPDSASLALLVSGEETLRLLLADAGGRGDPRQLITGQPLFSSWAPDSHSLLVHTGSGSFGQSSAGLYLVSTEPNTRPERIDVYPGDVRAPAWAPDGRYGAFAGDNGIGTNAVFLRTVDGGLRRFADLGETAAIVWSPTGDRLAWSSAVGFPTYYDGLHLATADGRTRLRLTDEPLYAFFWSPDGTHIAYLALDESERVLQWRVIPAAGGAARTVATFQPTREFVQFAIYFDQYVQSHTIWSPDSRTLLYAGWPAESSRDEPATLYTVPADGSSPARALTPGRIGFFAPATTGATPAATPTPRPLPTRRR